MGKTYKHDIHAPRDTYKKFVKKGGTQPKHTMKKMGPVHKVAGKIGQPDAAEMPNMNQPDPIDDGFQQDQPA